MAREPVDPETRRVVETLAAADAMAYREQHASWARRVRRQITDPLVLSVLILALAVIYLSVQTVSLTGQLGRAQHTRAQQLDDLASSVDDLGAQISALQSDARARDAYNAELLKQDQILRAALERLGADPNKIVGPIPTSPPPAQPQRHPSAAPQPAPSPTATKRSAKGGGTASRPTTLQTSTSVSPPPPPTHSPSPQPAPQSPTPSPSRTCIIPNPLTGACVL